MTRIDMATSEWHNLIAPVLPHAATDKNDPHLGVVRLEVDGARVFAAATDRSTLGCERHPLEHPATGAAAVPVVIHLDRVEAAATLRLFTHARKDDPPLRLLIDDVPAAPGAPMPLEGTAPRPLGLRIDSEEGTRLVLHDRRDPAQDPLGGWRKVIQAALGRDLAVAAPALALNASQLGRWARAVRRGERMAVFTGSDEGCPVLVLVEDHFAGIWVPSAYLDSAGVMLGETPWRAEL